MLRFLKRKLFGRKRYQRRHNNKNFIMYNNQKEICELRQTVHNLMSHLNIERIGNSNIVGDKKDAKKFDKQWS